MASWIVSVLVDRHSPGGEWSRHNRLLMDNRLLMIFSLWRMVQVDRLLMYHGQLFSWGIARTGRMVQYNYSPGAFPSLSP
jgi:hypothetical protein